jgi:hypothetical protein
LLTLFVLLAVMLVYWQTRPAVRLRRIALRELNHIQKTVSDDVALACELEHLLRRYAVVRFGRDTVASLSGERWIAFVIEHGGAAWGGNIGSDLLCIAYGGDAKAERTEWLAGARAFIRGRA